MKQPDVASFTLSMAYWIYLLSPFQSQPTKRNYLRLFYSRPFLFINIGIALLFLIAKICFDSPDRVVYGTLPSLFILTDLTLIRLSIKFDGQPFQLLLRGDSDKHTTKAILYSIILCLFPMVLSFILEFFLANSFI